MEKLPLVSVIIPCYNCEKWIAETIASVFNQTYKNIEIIIVDDGSTDNTKSIVKNIKDVIYYFQDNSGPSAARNLGIEKSNGKYIAFLDSDDLWNEDKLLKQINFLENNPDVHLVFTNVTLINETGKVLYTHYNKVPTEKSELIRKFYEGEIVMNTPTILARGDSINYIGGFNENLPLREDHYFLMKMANVFKIVHFKEALVKRRVNDQSLSSTVDSEKVFKLNKPFLEESINSFPYLSRFEKNVYSRMNFAVGKTYWKKRHKKFALKYIYKSMSDRPLKIKNYIFFIIIILQFKYEDIEKLKWKIRTTLKN
ncbi:glycosyltransferase family 2 protein [Alkalihalobacillus sp. NPDC078783]